MPKDPTKNDLFLDELARLLLEQALTCHLSGNVKNEEDAKEAKNQHGDES